MAGSSVRRFALRLAPGLAYLGVAGLPLGTADVVTTKDGVVVEGAVERTAAEVIVRTAAGEVRLPAASVASVVAGDSARTAARRALDALPATDVAARYRLAASLEAKGLADVAAHAYASILAVDPDHPAARRALGYEKVGDRWLTTAEARRARGLVLYEGTWRLPAEVDRIARGERRRIEVRATDLAAAMRTAATADAGFAAAAAQQVSAAPVGERLHAATGLLVHPEPKVRAWAAGELGRLGDESALRPLWSVAARDRSDDVRHAAVASLASFGRPDVAFPLVKALWSEHPSIVANPAAALGQLGDPHAVVWLVTRVVSHGASPGANFSQLTQQAYVQDFDVEVAQTSFIADPVIGTLQEGVVQDVKVLDLTIERTFVEMRLVKTIAHLAKADLNSPAEVASWWKEHHERFPSWPPATVANAVDPK